MMPDDATRSPSLVVFRVGDAAFGIDASKVVRVLWLPELSPIEEAGPWVIGVFDLEGRVVPVVELRQRFGHIAESYDADAAIVIVNTSSGDIGILASGLMEIAGAKTLTPSYEQVHEVLSGEAQIDDGLVMVLDVDSILGDASVAHHEPGSDVLALMPSVDDFPQLRERARAYAVPLDDSVPTEVRGLAVVRLGEERIGLTLGAVAEFADRGTLARVPCCPPHVLGCMNLRGELVAVMDIRPVLGLKEADWEPAGSVVVCPVDGLLLGIAVDAIVDVELVAEESILPPPVGVDRADSSFVIGEAHTANGLVTLVDLPRLIADGGLVVDEVVG